VYFIGLLLSAAVYAQGPGQRPMVNSPEVSADRKITFRLLAPEATAVRVAGGDMPGNMKGLEMTKGENGVWEATSAPQEPGAYRYTFVVNGVTVIDPRNPASSESNTNVWSVAVVPGSESYDTKDVPHGAVAEVTYQSKALGRARRMHVYTPPGYENGKLKYPVFYLLHGASDSDDSWTSVGRAGFILDNLIASGKAKPMIVVMPHGHTDRGGYRPQRQRDEFFQDFTGDIKPYIEAHYRLQPGRANRAIAGLSMGGYQTMNIGMAQLDQFAYIAVFSSGLISEFSPARPAANGPALPAGTGPAEWEKANAAMLNNEAAKKGLKLLWFGIGKDDFLLQVSRKTVEYLKTKGFTPVERETEGGHTWLNWRAYLTELAPQLFR